jgi:hypothetical protein
MKTRLVVPALLTVLAAAFLAVPMLGCTTVDTVKEAKGQGAKRVYDAPYEKVFDAVLAAAAAKKLSVVETDRAARRVVLSHGVTLLSWGENVAVFLNPLSARSTEVEIVSKAVMTPLNFPPDWDKILLEQIATELARTK